MTDAAKGRLRLFRFPGQFASLRRFPVPIAIAFLLALLLNLEILSLFKVDDVFWPESIFALVGAFFAALIADLIAESTSAGTVAKLAASIGAAIAIAALQLFHGRLFDQSAVVIGALVLAMMTAAHLRRGASNESFWQFDLRLGIAVATGALAFLIACAGLSLLLASVQYLFDVSVPGRVYGHIWVTGVALVAPLFALATMPAEFNEEFLPGIDPTLPERAVAALLNFALAPLVLAYALMLHIYAAKIAVTATMPKGEIGRLVLAFGGIGTAAFMLAYPWREKGYRPVRWLVAGWFWLMIVPALLLVIAVYERIAQYGITPERYCLCLFALWLAAMAAYLGARRGSIHLRAIPASLAAGLLLSSFGPWGAAAVSVRSQMGQLRVELRTHKLLAGDTLALAPARMATFNKASTSDPHLLSTLKELDNLDALGRIAPLFATIEDSPFKRGLSGRALQDAFAFYQQPPPPPPVIPLAFDIGRYQRMLGPMWIGQTEISLQGPEVPGFGRAKLGTISLTLADNILTAEDGSAAVSFDLTDRNRSKVLQSRLIPAREGEDRAVLVISPLWSGMSEAWLLLGTQSVPPK